MFPKYQNDNLTYYKKMLRKIVQIIELYINVIIIIYILAISRKIYTKLKKSVIDFKTF